LSFGFFSEFIENSTVDDDSSVQPVFLRNRGRKVFSLRSQTSNLLPAVCPVVSDYTTKKKRKESSGKVSNWRIRTGFVAALSKFVQFLEFWIHGYVN
jgi:hypothetical protein